MKKKVKKKKSILARMLILELFDPNTFSKIALIPLDFRRILEIF